MGDWEIAFGQEFVLRPFYCDLKRFLFFAQYSIRPLIRCYIFFSPKSPSRFLKGHMVLPLNFLAMIRSSLFEVKYKSITIGTPLLALNWSPLRFHPLLIVARYFKEIARPNHRHSYFSSKQKAVSVSRKYYWQSTCFLNKYSFVLTPVNVKPSSYTSLSGSFYFYNSSGSVCSLPLFETSTWIRAF